LVNFGGLRTRKEEARSSKRGLKDGIRIYLLKEEDYYWYTLLLGKFGSLD